MTMFKRVLRIVLYTLLIVVAAVVGALVVLTKTERGRANLAGIISTVASTDDRKVTVSGIDGIWSGRADGRPCRAGGSPGRLAGGEPGGRRLVAADASVEKLQRRPRRRRTHRARRGCRWPARSRAKLAPPRCRCRSTSSRSTCRKSRSGRRWPAAVSPSSPPRDRSRPTRRHWRSKPGSTSPATTASKARSTPTSISRPPTTSWTSI